MNPGGREGATADPYSPPEIHDGATLSTDDDGARGQTGVVRNIDLNQIPAAADDPMRPDGHIEPDSGRPDDRGSRGGGWTGCKPSRCQR